MIKYFLVSVLFTFSLYANTIEANYDVSYGFFGKLGVANAKIEKTNDNKYTIHIIASTTGLAKAISGNMQEKYESRGVFINDRYQPNEFIKITSKNDKIKTRKFIFNHETQTITLQSLTKTKESDEIWKETKETLVLDFWTNEDILSLFFNLKHYIPDTTKEMKKTLVAIGAGLSRKGQIDITIPSNIEKQNIKELLDMPKTKKVLSVKIYNKIFASSNGELYLSLNDKGICDKSLLKDVLLFGDIRGILQ